MKENIIPGRDDNYKVIFSTEQLFLYGLVGQKDFKMPHKDRLMVKPQVMQNKNVTQFIENYF